MPRFPRRARDTGSVTLEFAVVLPVLVVVLASALWVLALAGVHLRGVEAARAGARAVARGDSVIEVRRVVSVVAGVPPAAVTVSPDTDGGLVKVAVVVERAPPGVLRRLLPPWRATATAWAVPEVVS